MSKIVWKSLPFDEISEFQHIEDTVNPHGLQITNCSSVLDAYQTITSENFKNVNFISVIFTIDKKLEPLSFEQENKLVVQLESLNTAFLVSFTSSIDKSSCIYWKQKGCSKIFTLCELVEVFEEENDLDNIGDAFVHNFILTEILNGHSALLPQLDLNNVNEKLIRFRPDHIGASNKYNLLMTAVDRNSSQKVIQRLIEMNIDINYSINGVCAASLAQNHEKILLKLLKNDARFPSNFDSKTVKDDKLKIFIENINKVHKCLGQKKKIKELAVDFETRVITELKEIFSKIHKSRYFYDTNNISAATRALQVYNLHAYKFLVDNFICIGQHEDVDEIFNKLSHKNKEITEHHATATQSWYLDVLVGNSTVGHDLSDKNIKNLKLTKTAYEYLDKNEKIRPILKLVAASKNFEIIYDFTRDSIQHLNPQQSKTTRGVYDGFNKIYVSAMELLNPNPKKKLKSYGTLVHELCHYAMNLLFRNFSDPYALGDAKTQAYFQKIIEDIENNKKGRDFIVDLVFIYPESDRPREMIVRIPHMIAEYFLEEDTEILSSRLEFFDELYKFYLDLLPKMEACMRITKKIAKNPKEVSFNDLTEELKMRIRNSNVNFQGQEIVFSKLVENIFSDPQKREEIFRILKSDQILNILNNKIIYICRKFVEDSSYYVERTLENMKSFEFIGHTKKNPKISLESLIDEDVVIVSDSPGAGKSTTLIKAQYQIKQHQELKWIAFIDLKTCVDEFNENEFKFLKNQLNVMSILMEILNVVDPLEKEIFKGCWDSKNCIFLFDGVDEVSPNFTELVIYILTTIKERNGTKIWMTTRPQHVEQLEKIFKKKAFTLSPFTRVNRDKYLRNFYQNIGSIKINEKFEIFDEKSNSSSQKALCQKYKTFEERVQFLIDKIESFIRQLESEDKKYRQVNNPLMLKMMAELSLEPDFALEFKNSYKIYEKFILKTFKVLWFKGPIMQENRDEIAMSRTMSMLTFHQICALYTIFEHYFENVFTFEKIPIETLEIMQQPNEYNVDQVMTFGLLVPQSRKINENSKDFFRQFTFVHRTYAEFLVAQYLYDVIYSGGIKPYYEEEAAHRLLLLFFIAKLPFDVIQGFIMDFIELYSEKFKPFDQHFRNLMLDRFHSVYAHLQFNQFSIKSTIKIIHNFFLKDTEITRELWWINKNETFYIWMAKNYPYDWLDKSGQIKELLPEFFKDKSDIEKIIYGTHQRGSLLFQIWWIKKYGFRNFKENSGLDERNIDVYIENVEKLLPNDPYLNYLNEKMNFNEFYNTCEVNLPTNEKREIFLRNSFKIFAQNKWESVKDFNEIWSKISKLFQSDLLSIKQILMSTSSFNQTILYEVMKRGQNEEIALSLMEKTEHFLSKEEFSKILLKKCGGMNQTPFESLMYLKSDSLCLKIWKFYINNLNDQQIKEVLKDSNFLWMRMKRQNFEAFKSVLDLHNNVFSAEENRKLIYNYRFDILFDAVKESEIQTFKEIIKFIKKYCGENFIKILKYRQQFGATVFSNFKNNTKLQEKLAILLENALEYLHKDKIEILFWLTKSKDVEMNEFIDYILYTNEKLDNSKRDRLKAVLNNVIAKLQIFQITAKNKILLQMVVEFFAFCDENEIEKYTNLYALFVAIENKESKRFYRKFIGNFNEDLGTHKSYVINQILEAMQIQNDSKTLQIGAQHEHFENTESDDEGEHFFLEFDTPNEVSTEAQTIHKPSKKIIQFNYPNQNEFVIHGILDEKLQFLHDCWIAFFLSQFLSEIFIKTLRNDELELRLELLINLLQQNSQLFKQMQVFLNDFKKHESGRFKNICTSNIFRKVLNNSNIREASVIIFLTDIFSHDQNILNEIWTFATLVPEFDEKNLKILLDFSKKTALVGRYKELTQKLEEKYTELKSKSTIDINKFIDELKSYNLNDKNNLEPIFVELLMTFCEDLHFDNFFQDEPKILNIFVQKFGFLGETILMLLAKNFNNEILKVCWTFIEENIENQENCKEILKSVNSFGSSMLNYSIFNSDPRVFSTTLHIFNENFTSLEICELFFKPNQMLIYDVIKFAAFENCEYFVNFCEKIFVENPEKFKEILTQKDEFGESIISWFQSLKLESIQYDFDNPSQAGNSRNTVSDPRFEELINLLSYRSEGPNTSKKDDEFKSTVTYTKISASKNFKMLQNLANKLSLGDIMNEKIIKEFEDDNYEISDSNLWQLRSCTKEDRKNFTKNVLAVIKFNIFGVMNENLLIQVGEFGDDEGNSSSGQHFNSIVKRLINSANYTNLDKISSFLMIWMDFKKFLESHAELSALLQDQTKYGQNKCANAEKTFKKIFDEYSDWNHKTSPLTHTTIEESLEKYKRMCHFFALKKIFGNSESEYDIFTDLNKLELINNENYENNLSEIFGILGTIYHEDSSICFNYFCSFYVAQYIIENIYFTSNPLPSEAEARLNLLIFIASSKKFEKIKNLILNFIEFESLRGGAGNMFADNIRFGLIEQIGNVFQRYSHDLSIVEFLAKFFSKNEELMNFLWKIEENESFSIWYAKTYGLENWHQNYQKLYEIAKSTLKNDKFFELFRKGSGQKGSICYICWKYMQCSHDNENFAQILVQFLKETEIIVRVSEKNIIFVKGKFMDFYKHLNSFYEHEKQELFLVHYCEIFTNFHTELPEIWHEMSTIFHKIDLEEKFLLKLMQNQKFLLDNRENSEFFNIFVGFYNENDETSVIRFSKSLFKALKFCCEMFIINFWNYILKNSSENEVKKLLEIENENNETILQCSTRNKNHLVFIYMLKIHNNIFGTQKTLKILTKCKKNQKSFLVDNIQCTSAKTCEEIVKFLRNDSQNNFINVKSLFSNPDKEGDTFFHIFEGSRNYEEHMRPFISLATEIYSSYDLDALLKLEVSRTRRNILGKFLSFFHS